MRVVIRLAMELLAPWDSRPFWSGAHNDVVLRQGSLTRGVYRPQCPGKADGLGVEVAEALESSNVDTRRQNVVHAVLRTLPSRYLAGRCRASWHGLARDVGAVRQHHRHMHHDGWTVYGRQ